jgi:hypothetical protein
MTMNSASSDLRSRRRACPLEGLGAVEPKAKTAPRVRWGHAGFARGAGREWPSPYRRSCQSAENLDGYRRFNRLDRRVWVTESA